MNYGNNKKNDLDLPTVCMELGFLEPRNGLELGGLFYANCRGNLVGESADFSKINRLFCLFGLLLGLCLFLSLPAF